MSAVSEGKVLRSRKAVYKAAFKGQTIRRRRPSRYAHLVEKGVYGKGHREPARFIEQAQRKGATDGMAIFADKLKSGIAAEAAKLPK